MEEPLTEAPNKSRRLNSASPERLTFESSIR